MVRKAILIVSYNELKDSPSPYINDILYIKNHLLSSSGGYWQENQIKVLINPSHKLILKEFSHTNDEFRFVYYSGHGCMINNKQYILLENILISISQFTNKIKREVFIFDCCRNEYSLKILKKKFIIKEIRNTYSTRIIPELYNSQIEYSSGTLIVFSTLKNKSAFELSTCSYFIALFNSVLRSLNKLNQNKVLSTIAFLKLMDLASKKSINNQTISITTKKSCNYPFYISYKALK